MSVVRLYHGTSEKAWRSIQAEKRLRPIDFRDAARDTARVMGVAEQDIWDSVYFEFERNRHHRKDRGVYLSVHADTGKAYKASESYIDAAMAALALLGRPPRNDMMVADVIERVCGKPVLVTLDVPWSVIVEHEVQRGLAELPMEKWIRSKRSGAGVVIIEGSLDAKFVVSAEVD